MMLKDLRNRVFDILRDDGSFWSPQEVERAIAEASRETNLETEFYIKEGEFGVDEIFYQPNDMLKPLSVFYCGENREQSSCYPLKQLTIADIQNAPAGRVFIHSTGETDITGKYVSNDILNNEGDPVGWLWLNNRITLKPNPKPSVWYGIVIYVADPSKNSEEDFPDQFVDAILNLTIVKLLGKDNSRDSYMKAKYYQSLWLGFVRYVKLNKEPISERPLGW